MGRMGFSSLSSRIDGGGFREGPGRHGGRALNEGEKSEKKQSLKKRVFNLFRWRPGCGSDQMGMEIWEECGA